MLVTAFLGLVSAVAVCAPGVVPAVAQTAAAPVQNEARARGDEASNKKDYTAAMKWYLKAASQGDAEAENSIGYMYDNGQGVKEDNATAARWYRKAADHGLAAAQYNLGIDYENGTGVSRDLDQARAWMQKAAAGGDGDAKNWLASQAASLLPQDPSVQELRNQALQKKNKYFPTQPPTAAAEVDVTGTIGSWQQERGEWVCGNGPSPTCVNTSYPGRWYFRQVQPQFSVFGEDMSVFILRRDNNEFIASSEIPSANGKISTAGVVMMITTLKVRSGESVTSPALSGVVWTPRTNILGTFDLTDFTKITTRADFNFETFRNSPDVIPFANGYAVNLFGQKLTEKGVVDVNINPKGNYVTDDGRPLYGRLIRASLGHGLEEDILVP